MDNSKFFAAAHNQERNNWKQATGDNVPTARTTSDLSQQHEAILKQMKIDNYIDMALFLISLTSLIIVLRKEFK